MQIDQQFLQVFRGGAGERKDIDLFQRLDLDGDLGDKTGDPLGVRDQVEVFAPEGPNFPRSQDNPGRDDVLGEVPIFIAANPCSTLGQPSSHTGGWVAGGIKSNGQAAGFEFPIKLLPGDARLDDRCHLLFIDGDDLFHVVEINHEALLDRDRAPISG